MARCPENPHFLKSSCQRLSLRSGWIPLCAVASELLSLIYTRNSFRLSRTLGEPEQIEWCYICMHVFVCIFRFRYWARRRTRPLSTRWSTAHLSTVQWSVGTPDVPMMIWALGRRNKEVIRRPLYGTRCPAHGPEAFWDWMRGHRGPIGSGKWNMNSINPRPTGGGGLFRAPPLVFLRYLLNWCRYYRQTCSTLSPNIFHIVLKF